MYTCATFTLNTQFNDVKIAYYQGLTKFHNHIIQIIFLSLKKHAHDSNFLLLKELCFYQSSVYGQKQIKSPAAESECSHTMKQFLMLS